ncbi:MAG: hypothetical protein J6T86_01775 [Bacteroidales bacterium]|nr:hypothetical protein [Bacteroidales bacterium]
MKKILTLMVVCSLIFASCNTKKTQEAEQPECAKQEQCDAQKGPKCEMSEEQKKAMEDWKNWENLDETRKAELLNERKAQYDQMKAEKEAMEAKKAEMEAKKAEFEKAMANWDKLTLDEKKAAFDLMPCCGKCCKGGEAKPCDKGHGDKPCCKGDKGHGSCPKDAKECPKH